MQNKRATSEYFNCMLEVIEEAATAWGWGWTGQVFTLCGTVLQVTAWLAAAVLFLMFVVYIFLTIAFCCRCGRQNEGPQYSSFHDAATLRQSKKNPFNNYGTTTNPFNDS